MADPVEIISTTPINTNQSVRSEELRCITSCMPGKIVPLAYIPLLREDRVSMGRARIKVEMKETARTLLNGVNVTVMTHFVPYLAFDRFTDLGSMNRSYMGVPDVKGGQVIPFFTTHNFTGKEEIYRAMGIHYPVGKPMNGTVREAYNELVNFRRRARSNKLPMRAWTDNSLAQAFWKNPALSGIVPDFDQAAMDGEVPLAFLSNRLAVRGIGLADRAGENPLSVSDTKSLHTGGVRKTEKGWRSRDGDIKNGLRNFWISEDPNRPGFPNIYAELAEKGVSLSLSNIDLAKKTAAFAKMREQYKGLEDDYIIDLLMSGIRVPDEQLRQPILLDRKSTIIGYSKRSATDGANLDKSVTTGETFVDISFRTPPMNTGGIILITMEIVPEQLFERQDDYFLSNTKTVGLPDFTRDFLDPEKVDIVRNKFVDCLHTAPEGTFGYAPLNHKWKRNFTRVGGKFMRKLGDAWSEDRQRIWSIETKDPKLTSDFYMVNNLPTSVFADRKSEPFEVTTMGGVQIVGSTVFGKELSEDNDDYAEVMDKVDTGRIGMVSVK